VSAQLSPSCTFEPSTAQDVAGALAVLVRDKAQFAVRGGGHMPTPGASNIEHGVLISLNNMLTMQLAEHNTIAQLGPGLRWLQVYSWIKSYGLGVLGGRFAPVGVSGILIGGGISFFGSRYGWASDMVSNYQVVLANSTIVNANAHVNSDLFWALKGGSSNYGIVTRFDIKTFPLREVYGGQSTFSGEYLDEFLDAASSYSVIGGGSDDIDGSYGPTVQVDVATGEVTLLGVCIHIGSDPNPAAFANYTRIPTLSTNNQVWPSLADALAPTVDVGARTQR
jgi:FAD/FMN-containing dehydrogenase